MRRMFSYWDNENNGARGGIVITAGSAGRSRARPSEGAEQWELRKYGAETVAKKQATGVPVAPRDVLRGTPATGLESASAMAHTIKGRI
jgi:hypothetical protein